MSIMTERGQKRLKQGKLITSRTSSINTPKIINILLKDIEKIIDILYI